MATTTQADIDATMRWAEACQQMADHVLISTLQERLAKMSPQQRLAAFEQIAGEFCTHCGLLYGPKPWRCYCTRDD